MYSLFSFGLGGVLGVYFFGMIVENWGGFMVYFMVVGIVLVVGLLVLGLILLR